MSNEARVERKLAAILAADVQGYSRLMGEDEVGTLRMLTAYREVTDTLIQHYRGRIVGTAGDSVLAEFASAVDAVQCAMAIQQALKTNNADLPPERRMEFRIGINVGDVIVVEGAQLYGDGVNIAARLEALADGGGICISGTVYDQIETKLPLGYEFLGEQSVKNIAKPVRVYRVVEPGVTATVRGRSDATSSRPTPSLLLPDKPSLIVLPFVNMSNDPDQDYFSDGLTEDITTDLSRISSLFVISRNSAFTYKGKAAKAQDISREMGVRYVVEGSVRKGGEWVRITAQLIDATTDHHLWAERYDRSLQDIFALQDEIVQKIVTTLELQLTLEEQGYRVRKHTHNLEAYDYFLRGVESYWRVTQEGNTQARQMFERAIALDPQYAEAHARLGLTYWLQWTLRWSADPQTLERALALAHQALALDYFLPIAHSVLSNVYAWKQQYEQAITEGERAIALDPNNADSYAWQAQALNNAGRPEEALQMMAQAMRLNPRYPPLYLWEVSFAYRFAGQYAEAIATLKELTSRNPNMLMAHVALAHSYWLQWISQQSPPAQTLEPAMTAIQRALTLSDSLYLNHLMLGLLYLYQQQYDQALAEMERGVTLTPTVAESYACLAEVLSRMGRTEEALEAAAQALRLKPEVAGLHFAGVSIAFYLAGRPEEAVAPLKQHLIHFPNMLGAHLLLTAAYSVLGREAEARAEAAEVLRLNPQFSLTVLQERMPIKDPAVLERHLAALRKAGLK